MDRLIAWASAELGKDYLGRDAGEARIPRRHGSRSLEASIAFATRRLGVGYGVLCDCMEHAST